VLFSERADSVEAAVRASDKIDNAKQALMEGKPEQASAELAQAQQDLAKVRPQEGKDELVGVKDFLSAKAAETPSGTQVDPGSPLKADKGRPIPAGAALSQQPTTAGTLTPEPTTGEANNPPAASPRPTHSPRPTSRQHPPAVTTDAPVAPELTTGEAGAAPTSAPVTVTQEGRPDATATTTSSGMGRTHTSSGGSSEDSAPPTTS
jgi:hypothetical protein